MDCATASQERSHWWAAGEGLLFFAVLGAVGAAAIIHYPRHARFADEPNVAVYESRELPPPTTYFVVVPREPALAMQQGIDEGNNVRHSAGLGPIREVTLGATNLEEAHALVRAIEEGNRILAGFGTEDSVILVDLTS